MAGIKIEKYEDEDSWLEGREGRITGTRAKGIMVVPKDGGENTEFYKILAEKYAIPGDGENAMERGKRLELEALERFESETGKKLNKDLIIVSREDDPDIAYSPDALIGKTEDVEVKCRNSANHFEALMTQKVPKEYMSQILQGFVVNDALKRRYMVFYDPRCPKDFFYITIERKDVQAEVEKYLNLERLFLARVRAVEAKLTF
jgi:predicted phage-related endonuclease